MPYVGHGRFRAVYEVVDGEILFKGTSPLMDARLSVIQRIHRDNLVVAEFVNFNQAVTVDDDLNMVSEGS